MNKKVIAIFSLAIAALVVLWAYAFGPLSGATAIKVNPASRTATAEQSFNVYHNRDLAENFYTVKFPQAWQLQPSSPAGSYRFTFASGSGSVELQDVADNTTLELFILSQQEPDLKKTVPAYNRVSYGKITLSGADAYQLTYHSTASSTDYETVKTYIPGTDHAVVVTLIAKQADFAGMQPLFTEIINSVHWEK